MRYGHALLLPFVFLVAPIVSGCVEDAFAKPPARLDNPEQATRVGGSHWARQWSVPTSAGTAGLVNKTPGDNTWAAGDQKVFEWNTTIRVSCVAAAEFHWVLDTSVTITLASGLVTDAAPMTGFPSTGAGNAFRVEAGTYVEELIEKTMFDPNELALGSRTGFCTGTTSGLNDGNPCDADADCPGGACRGENSGSCTESSVYYCSGGSPRPYDHIKGGFLQSLGATAADCFISEVR